MLPDHDAVPADAPPEGVGRPFDWGREEHVDELLGDAFDLEIERARVAAASTRAARRTGELFSSSYGPTKTLAESLDDERREELHRAWVDFATRSYATRTARSSTTRE